MPFTKSKVHDVQCHTLSEPAESDPDEFFIDCIQCDANNLHDNQAFCVHLVGRKKDPVKFKLDARSQANKLPIDLLTNPWVGVHVETSERPNEGLLAYNSYELESL